MQEPDDSGSVTAHFTVGFTGGVGATECPEALSSNVRSDCGRIESIAALIPSSSDDNPVPYGGARMRTTLALDDELVAKAQAFTGLKEKSSLVREALKALIERESARRLARLGGSEPDIEAPPRRRPTTA
jgi:Arc/MetJ family transcription regulator